MTENNGTTINKVGDLMGFIFVQAVSNFWEEEREWLGLQVLYVKQVNTKIIPLFHLLTYLKRLGHRMNIFLMAY
jgi:hypothetical protein